MNEKKPLSLTLETAKAKFISAFNNARAEANLPAYLLEGILAEILADIRSQKNLELILDIERMKKEEKDGGTE